MNNKLEQTIQLGYRFAQEVENSLPLEEVKRKWQGIRKKIKKYWNLETRNQSYKYYDSDEAASKIKTLYDLALTIEYYSDRWCRGRIYTIDKSIRRLADGK